ncbi:hypothetical protein MKX01_024547, partial [Papaver californicum]
MFISKSKRSAISSVGYGVGISFLVFTLLFSYYSPFKSTSLLTYRFSFQNNICFSKSSRNVFSISWHFCHPNSTTSSDSLLQDKETNFTKTGFTNETASNGELDKHSSSFSAPEAGDNSLVQDGESVDATTNNETSSFSVHVVEDKSSAQVQEEEIVNNVTTSISDPQLGDYTSTTAATAIDSIGNATETATTTTNEEQECDIFDGQWVLREDNQPYYPEGSCPYIDKDFDCYINKRPDNDFLKWQWQPKNCNIL